MIIDYLPRGKRKGLIPKLAVKAQTLPEAWEKSLLALWQSGARLRTKYDRKGDPASKFATMVIEIERPWQEPRIHRCLPTGGFGDLWIYEKEIVFGARDWWIDKGEDYTYHDRLFKWRPADDWIAWDIDQINNFIIPVLAGLPTYQGAKSDPFIRRAIATTWRPGNDPKEKSTPCLQYIWFQMVEGPPVDGFLSSLVLNMEWCFRSHDAYKAAFFNFYGLSALHKWIAQQVWEKRQELAQRGILADDDNPQRPIIIGKEINYSLNYHIYGADFWGNEQILGFRPWLRSAHHPENNFLRTDDERVQAGFDGGRETLKKEFIERGIPWPEEWNNA